MKNRASIRNAALFIALSMIIQFAAVVFLTPAGLLAIYPVAVFDAGENVVPDYSFGEYYDLGEEFAGRDMFFIGADTTVADSYTAIFDLFRYLCRNFSVKTLTLGVGRSTAERINACVSAADDVEFQEKLKDLRAGGIFPEELFSFVRALTSFNRTMPRSEGITVRSVYADTAFKATVEKVHSDIISRWGSVSPEVQSALSISDIDEFFAHFHGNEDAYRAFLGDEAFANFLAIDEHRLAGDYKEWKIASQIEDLAGVPSLIVVDRDVIGDGSALRSYAEKLGAKPAFVGVQYVSCHGLNKGAQTDVHDFSLPLASDRAIYFVSAKSIDRFDSWYRFICDPSGNRNAGESRVSVTPDFFVVVGSDCVKYADGQR